MYQNPPCRWVGLSAVHSPYSQAASVCGRRLSFDGNQGYFYTQIFIKLFLIPIRLIVKGEKGGKKRKTKGKRQKRVERGRKKEGERVKWLLGKQMTAGEKPS